MIIKNPLLRFIPVTFILPILLSLSITQSNAHPVFGEQFQLKQPDQTLVEVNIWGDEFYQHVESPDGYTLIRDPQTQYICYAELNAAGNDLISTGQIYTGGVNTASVVKKHINLPSKYRLEKVKQNRPITLNLTQALGSVSAADDAPLFSPPSKTTTGNRYGVCLLIDFPDVPGTIPQSEVIDYCNQPGYSGYGNMGSIRDYFMDVSNNLLDYTNTVTAYYTALHEKSYYDDPTESAGPKARELILEALNWLDDAGFDFSTLDGDHNGIIDGINAFYAGSVSSGWAMGLWPHSGYIYFSADGVYSQRYQITDMKTSLTLQTFCHENGHMLCYFPDLYDYGSESYGVGRYCLMAYGSSNKCYPMSVSAYLKYKAGWMTITQFSQDQSSAVSLSHGTNHAYRYVNPDNSKEYFMLEVRIKQGRDTYLPDEGLAIWHVDEAGSNNYEQMTSSFHYECSLIQADNHFDLEHRSNVGDSTDLFTAALNATFTDTTSPDGLWWSGDASGIYIREISAPGSVMTFKIGPPLPDLVIESISSTPTSVFTNDDILFTVTIKNIGELDADDFTVGFWDNLASAPTSTSADANTITSAGLAVDESITLNFTISATSPGSKTAFAYVDIVDDNGTITESDESNNVSSAYSWLVQSPPYSGPDTVAAIYPNPARALVNLQVKAEHPGDVIILMYNFSGELVSKVAHTMTTQDEIIPLRTDHVAPGIYIVKVLMNNRLLKQSKVAITR